MIPDSFEDVVDLARTIEKRYHSKGWDQPADMGYLADFDGTLDARLVPVNLANIDRHPPTALAMIGRALKRSRQNSEAAELFPEEVRNMLAGVWVCVEGWYSNLPEDQRGGRAIADIPGSKETRMVHAIDCGGRYVLVLRIRGQAPQVITWGPGVDSEYAPGGALIDGMRDYLLEMCVFLPDGGCDLKAIEAVGRRD